MSVAQGGVSGLLAGRYAIERELGQGATATVHLARDTRAGISVAVKLLRVELAESNAAKRFLKEIRRTASLDHPRILKVLDSGEHDGRPFFVLPYMEGGTLRQRLKREPQLPLDDAIAIARSVAEALDYAHERGLIHQDVKPENILFTGGVACLGDFGIAHALEAVYGEASSTTHVIRGTPAYMSPEQAAGEMNLDGRSDQYSLACVFYEMVTGMPAFMGPTPESVIAQRFTHGPREVRVYRPSVPAGVEQALGRALAIGSADRYETVTEFVTAVASAEPDRRAPPTPRNTFGRAALGAGVAVLVAAAAWLGSGLGGAADAPLDTTRVVVLPFDEATGPREADLLHEGLRRWRGISVVETFATLDAIRRYGGVRTIEDARHVARELGAGRFIRGRTLEVGGRPAAYAALYDVAREEELYHARVWLPDSALAIAAYSALADSLLLRGAAAEPRFVPGASSASLPATQAFLAARLALSEWDLATTDSLLVLALQLDDDNARAQYWLAQVRSWMIKPVSQWHDAARRAREDITSFSPEEQPRVAALAYLAAGDYPTACEAYRELTARAPRDFTAWYGLGDCHRMDREVIADAASPSGYRFRSSYYRAMLAYRSAFEAFPSAYRGVQHNAFERLQFLLFTDGTQLRSGRATDAVRSQFLARPTARGDTIAFIPYPRDQVLAGQYADGPGVTAAVRVARRMFRDIASAWSAALPPSASTREAVAVSLEMLGDLDAARDSLRAARALATEPATRLRLAVAEIIVGVKIGLAGRPDEIRQARTLADSVLQNATARSMADAELLLRLAVLTGRCAAATRLARQTVQPIGGGIDVPPGLLSSAHEAAPGIALGCRSPTDIAPVAAGFSAIRDSLDRSTAVYATLGPLVAYGFPSNPSLIALLAAGTGDYVLVAQRAILRGDTASARRTMERILQSRARPDADFPSDVALVEAHLWLAIGDTAMATTMMDRGLRSVQAAQPMSNAFTMQNVLALAAIGRMLGLRADIERAQGRSGEPWSGLRDELWRDADPALRQTP